MVKGAVVKRCKSVKDVQNSERQKSSSAAMIGSWTGAKNLTKILPPSQKKINR